MAAATRRRSHICVVWDRDDAPAPVTEMDFIGEIERDLRAARSQHRFEDMLHHLDELFIFHKHTESAAIRSRCAALMAGA